MFVNPRTSQPLPKIVSDSKGHESEVMVCKGPHPWQAKVSQQVIHAAQPSRLLPRVSPAAPGSLGWTPVTSWLPRTALLCLPPPRLAKYHLQTKPSSVLWGTALQQVKTMTPY